MLFLFFSNIFNSLASFFVFENDINQENAYIKTILSRKSAVGNISIQWLYVDIRKTTIIIMKKWITKANK